MRDLISQIANDLRAVRVAIERRATEAGGSAHDVVAEWGRVDLSTHRAIEAVLASQSMSRIAHLRAVLGIEPTDGDKNTLGAHDDD